jgi:hypothetical protein
MRLAPTTDEIIARDMKRFLRTSMVDEILKISGTQGPDYIFLDSAPVR